MDIYNTLLLQYINNPNDALSNWNMGLYYDTIGQTASAVSFYLRTAERTDDDLLKYECLLRSALCFQRQGSRNFTVRGLLQHAVSIKPDRPEGYFLLSRHYERETYDGHWNDCYTIASIGHSVADLNCEPLKTDVDYPLGNYGLLFEMAVSSWWCGLCDESRDLFTKLYLEYPLDDTHYASVHTNLNFLKSPIAQFTPFDIYRFYEHDKLIQKFNNSNIIYRNYSEAFQDMFVLTMFNGKSNGSYLEIGAGNPIYGNNTYLLESKFGWRGMSIDYDSDLVDRFNEVRAQRCLNLDATEIDYNEFIQNNYKPNNYIDYLQIDCDPPEVSYKVLCSIDFSKYQFGLITFEHDNYTDPESKIQNLSRDILKKHGYIPIHNISPDGVRSYEDWWFNPTKIDPKIVKRIQIRVEKLGQNIINAKQLFVN